MNKGPRHYGRQCGTLGARAPTSDRSPACVSRAFSRFVALCSIICRILSLVHVGSGTYFFFINMDTAYDLLEKLEQRLFAAVAELPRRRPWIEAERREISRVAEQCLGVRRAWLPDIRVHSRVEVDYQEVKVQRMRCASWDRCYCAAHLYFPTERSGERIPLVILSCGHGKEGKQTPAYSRMAWHLARTGAAVLVPDNIGQGERIAMGHSDVLAPFQCGLSLQGLIVMETMAWLRWALSDDRFDPDRIAAIGNSGGGTLTLFLGALCGDRLAAVSSSGYPSTFEFIARKEKRHCHCNILPGIVGQVEMWQLYGCCAPTPLFLFQGRNDNLFPEDLFDVTCRKVAEVYYRCGVPNAFRHEVFPGHHSWDVTRRQALCDFLAAALDLPGRSPESDDFDPPPDNCYDRWPADALSTDALSCAVTGVKAAPVGKLYDIFQPGAEVAESVAFRRVSGRQLAAQYQAFIHGYPHRQRPIADRAVCTAGGQRCSQGETRWDTQ